VRFQPVYLRLYKQYVRPHLEFAAPAWSPWLETDKKLLENVQIKAVKSIVGLRGQNYAEKFIELGLYTLEARIYEQDMVQAYKITKVIGKIEHERFFEKAGNRAGMRTRLAAQANSLKVKKARTELRKKAFSMRVVKGWNSLPEEI
jgi:hypothetical protein